MSVLLPSMRGALGGVSVPPPPSFGNLLFSWAADGSLGTTWEDSSQTIPAALGGRVGAVVSAQGLALSNSNSLTKPLLQGSVQNGKPGLYFSRSRSDWLGYSTVLIEHSTITAMKAASALTAFVVANMGGGAGTSIMSLFEVGRNDDSKYLYIRRTFGGQFTAGRRGTSANQITYTPPATTDAHAEILTFDGFVNDLKLYIDAVAQVGSVTPSGSDGSTDWKAMYMGCHGEFSQPVSNHLQGYIFELLIYDADATGSDLTDLFTYATAKWGLT